MWLSDHEGPSSQPHLMTQYPCLWSKTPACLYPHPAHTLHGFLIHSVTCQSAPPPFSTPRPHEFPSAPSLWVSKGFAGALWVLCSYPTHPAQQRHMVNTSSSLTADLVSQKDWYALCSFSSETRKKEFIQDRGEASFWNLSPGKPRCETLSPQ